MAEKKKEIKIRETKDAIFDILKAAAPSLFGSKLWTDVSTFGDDPGDTSKFIIIFNEEDDA